MNLRHFVTITLVLLTIAFASAQTRTIDSLRALLPRKTLKENSDVHLELSYEYFSHDYHLAMFHARKVHKIAQSIDDTLSLIKSQRLIALAHRRLGSNDSSNIIGINILALAQKYDNKKELCYLLKGLGVGFLWTDELDRALMYNLDGLKYARKLGSIGDEADILTNTGLVYYKLRNFPKALQYFRASSIAEQLANDSSGLAFDFLNASLCYSYNGEFDSARYCLRQAVKAKKTVIKELDFMYDHAVLLGEMGKYDSAIMLFEKTLKEAIKTKDVQYQLFCIGPMIEFKAKVNRHDEALQNFKSLEYLLNGRSFNKEAMSLYKTAAELYETRGDYRRYAKYINKYVTLKDSLRNHRFINSLIQIEQDFLAKEKIAAQAELAKKQATIHAQNRIGFFLSAIVLLLILVAILSYSSYKLSQRNNEKLEQRVSERTIELEKLNIILKQTLESEEYLSNKRAQDIHNLLNNIISLSEMGLKETDKQRYLNEISIASHNFSRLTRTVIT